MNIPSSPSSSFFPRSLVPYDFIDPVKANKATSPNSEIGKNTNKSTITLCIKLSIIYICFFMFLLVYLVLVCSILSTSNLLYKTTYNHIFYNGYLYDISYQTQTDLSIYLIYPVLAVIGLTLIAVNVLLILFTGNLSSYHKNINKKILNAFFAGILLMIPSYVACFILISKCKKIKKEKSLSKNNEKPK